MKINLKKTVIMLLVLSIVISVIPSAFVFAAEKAYFEFEAENAVLSGDNHKIVEDKTASGGKVLNGVYVVTSPEQIEGKPIKFEIDVPLEETYTFWIRGKATDGSTDSIWGSVDDEEYKMMQINISSDYKWHAFTTMNLTPGKHSFNLSFREPNYKFDKVLITNDNAFLPDGNPYSTPDFKPEGRPRVMIAENKLETIKKNLSEAENKPYYDKVIENTYIITKGVFQGNFNYDSSAAYIESNAFMYLITGDEKYGNNAISGLFERYDSLNHEACKFPYRSAGYQIYLAAVVFDWCYDLLTAETKEAIYNNVIEDCQVMEIGWPPVKQTGTASSHESEFQVMRDMLSFAIACSDDFPEFYNVVMGKVIDEYIPTRNYYYNNTSFHNQGDSYGMYRYTAEMFMTCLLSAMGKGELISEKQHDMAYHFIVRRRPDGAHMQDGDMFNIPLSSYIRTQTNSFLAGNYYKDPYIRNEVERSGMKLRNNSDVISPVTFLILNEPSVGVRDYSELPLTTYGGNQQGVMTARTSWDEGINSNTMMVSMKISEHITRSHQHLDSGNFEIYYKGPLALDSGIYNGSPFDDEEGNTVTNVESGSSHDVNYHHRTIAHNAMLVYDPNEVPVMGEANDGGQRAVPFPNATRSFESFVNDETFEYGRVLAYDFGDDMSAPSYSYLEGDLTKAYTDKVTDYTRAFMFFNFFDDIYPGALVVFDRVESKDPSFKKTWLLHSQEEPEISGNKTTIRRTEQGYNGRLINETLLPKADDALLTKIGGEGMEYWVDGKNYTAVAENHYENGNWRIELSPVKEAKSNYFLNVLQVADNTLNPTPLESEYLETESHIGVQINNRAVYFGKTKERISDSVKIKGNLNNDKDIIYTVCGLSAGEWQVSGIGIKASSNEGGVISFTAPAGEYTLTKVSETPAVKNYSVFANTVPSEEEIPTFRKDGYFFDFSDGEYVKEGEAYIPVKEATSILREDATVSQKNETVEITYGTNHIKFIAESDIVEKNGNDYKVSYAPEVKNGIFYVPAYLLAEFLEISCITGEFSKITDFSEGEPLPEPYISTTDKIYVSEDGCELAYFGSVENYSELNVMEYGVLYSSLPNGVIGGNNTLTLKAEPVNNKKHKGDFGIHIKDYLFKLGTGVYITPYLIYDDNGETKTVYSQTTSYTNRYNYVENKIPYETIKAENAITADTNSRTSQYLTNYSPTGPWMQTNLYNGVPMNNSFLGTLKRAMIQLDVSKIPNDSSLIKNITLTVTGQCSYIAGHITPYCPEGITVNAYDFSEYEWDETSVNASATSVGPTLSEIVEKTPFDSFFVEKSATTSGPWVKKSVDVTEIVRNAKSKGLDKVTVILLADNSERNTPELAALKDKDSNNRDELMFVMGTKENPDEEKRPYVTYGKKQLTDNKLSEILVNGEKINNFSPDVTEYEYSYVSDSLPSVTAKAQNSDADVLITQADIANKTAVISVADKKTGVRRRYTVEFKKERSSTEVTVKTPITGDTNSRTNQYSNWYTPTGIYMLVNLYNGAPVNNDSNNSLHRSIIQIDLTKLADVDLSKDIFLNVVGRAQFSKPSANPPYSITVNAYGDYGFSWSEDTINPSASSVGPSISEVLTMNKIGSFTVNANQTSFHTKSINIRDFVVKAMALGKEKINIILFADNQDRVQYSPGGEGHPERDLLEFQMGTKENTSATRQPSITYFKYN